MLRRILTLVLSFICLFAFASCKTVNSDPDSSRDPENTEDPAPTEEPGKTVLYQVVREKQSLMMCYVIKTSHNKIIVIDGGIDGAGKEAPTYLFKELQTISGQEHPVIDAWIFTHVHNDHYYEFVKMAEQQEGKFTVKNIYFNFPSEAFIQKYEPNEIPILARFKAAYNKIFGENAFENYNGCQVGDKIEVDNVTFDILQIPNEKMTANPINNSSMIFRMTAEGQTVMFLGDAGVEAGSSLIRTYGDALKSDFVQMAHHGQAGVNKAAYAKIDPKVCLWPIPSWVWENNNKIYQTHNTQKWVFEDLAVKHHYISGLYGTEAIELPFDFDKEPEHTVTYNK